MQLNDVKATGISKIKDGWRCKKRNVNSQEWSVLVKIKYGKN